MSRRILPVLCVLACLCIFLVPPSASAAIVNTSMIGPSTLYTGIVGWWTFDGADMINNVRDRSGQGNDGHMTAFTSTSSASTQGMIGQALKFTDAELGQGINAGNGSSLNLGSTGSISAWIKCFPGTYYQNILSKYDDDNDLNGYSLVVNDQSLYLFIADGSTYIGLIQGLVVCTGKWQHVVGTWNGSFLNLYVDGVSVIAPLAQTLNPVSNIYDLIIGNSPVIPLQYRGSIDDVRVYNRALSAAEITQLYSTTAGAKINVTPTLPTSSLNSGLVGWWTLDGNDTNWNTNKLVDKSGNGNTGTLINTSTTTSSVLGKIASALNFSCSRNQYADMGNNASMQMTAAGTLSGWVRTTDRTQFPFLFGKFDWSADANGFAFARSDSGFTHYVDFIVGDATGYDQVATQGTIDDGSWHMITGTWDGTNIKVYTDGGSLNTISQTRTPVNNARNFRLAQSDTDPTNCYTGSLDDVRVYNRALSAAEVAQLYNMAAGAKINVTPTLPTSSLNSGLVGWWTFDGKDTPWTSATAATTIDKSGNGNTGTLTNMAQATSSVLGKLGQALKFDGTTSYVSAGITSSLNLGHTGTISAWVKTTDNNVTPALSGNPFIAGTGNLYNDLNGYWLSICGSDCGFGSEGFAYFGIAGGTYQYLRSSSSITDGKWHLITGIWDGSQQILYIDGVGGTPQGQLIDAVSNVYPFTIGKDPANSSAYMDGSIDDVRVYNRALSAAEVLKLYNIGR